MDNSNSIKYDKLIRDKIPEVIEATGSKAVVEVLDDERYQKYLERKLGEELKEYLEAGSIEELADLIEVVYALLESRGISLEEFERIRVAKVEKRGLLKETFTQGSKRIIRDFLRSSS